MEHSVLDNQTGNTTAGFKLNFSPVTQISSNVSHLSLFVFTFCAVLCIILNL